MWSIGKLVRVIENESQRNDLLLLRERLAHWDAHRRELKADYHRSPRPLAPMDAALARAAVYGSMQRHVGEMPAHRLPPFLVEDVRRWSDGTDESFDALVGTLSSWCEFLTSRDNRLADPTALIRARLERRLKECPPARLPGAAQLQAFAELIRQAVDQALDRGEPTAAQSLANSEDMELVSDTEDEGSF